MSEFSNSYFNQAQSQDAYNEAVASATGQTQAGQAKFDKNLSKYQQEQEKEAKKESAIEATTGVIGGAVFTEGLRDLVGKAGKKVVKKVVEKVGEKVGNVVDDIADRATTATKNIVSKAADSIVDKAKSASSTARDLMKLPDADIEGTENLVKRNALKSLQAKTEKQFGKFDPAQQAIDAADSGDLGEQALSDARALTSSGNNIPATLEGQEVDDINPLDFFKSSKGFDAGGELTRGKVGNPFSITSPENKEALEGVKELKVFGSKAEQLSDARMGDQLQPMRDLVSEGRGDIKPSQIKSYNQAKAEARAKANVPKPDPDADIKASLPDVDELDTRPVAQPPAPEPTPQSAPQSAPEPDADLVGKDRDQDTQETNVSDDSLAEDTGADAEADADADADADASEVEEGGKSGVSETSFGADTGAGAEAGADAGSIATGEVIADTTAAAEGGLNPVADIAAIGLGLAGVLGGIFGKKKASPPPKPPPPPPLLNPAVALGI